MTEKLVVIGAGMAGLCAALSLASTTREIVVLEKDAPPPAGGADAAFFDWNRRGVGQLRHSHAFLARLRNIIKLRHPDLLQALLDAGCREIGFVDMLPRALRQTYRSQPGDEDLVVLTSRRTTLEMVIRRYAEALPGVSILPNVTARGLIVERTDTGQLAVRGVKGDRGGEALEWRGDLVVDAAGRTSATADWLAEAGAVITDRAEDCGILYYTRHFRLLPDIGEPPPDRRSGAGDLGFIKYSVFPADNGCFSITLAVPEIEMALRTAIVHPETFDGICARLLGVATWTDPARSQPISKVLGMGDLRSRWRGFVSEGQRAVLGFFAVGDSLLRTNPLYGRGCSFAAVEAELLAGVLNRAADPAVRARLYDADVREELSVYFDNMRDQDRIAARAARNALTPGHRATLPQAVARSFFDDGARIAVRSDLDLMRAALRDFHMLDPPGAWLRRPANAAKVVGRWARGKARNADLYPPPLGPGRAEMLTALGLNPDADIERLRNAAA